MASRKLTDPFIRAIKTPDKRIELFDSQMKGLAVRVSTKGKKTFIQKYYFAGKNKKITLGPYPTLSLADARRLASEYQADIAKGNDPAYVKHEREYGSDTFSDLADKYIESQFSDLRPKTQQEHSRIIRNELLPAIGKYPLDKITKSHILDLLDSIAIKRGKKTMANRVRARLHTIFEFAIGRGLMNINPVATIKPIREGETKRARYYSREELQSLWGAFEKQPNPNRAILKVLLLTAQRSRETRHMRWDEIHKGIWTIPAELSKSKREHDVPLSSFALQVIEGMRPMTGQYKFVFNSTAKENTPIVDLKRTIKSVRKESGVTDFRLHDLRRTAATYMAELRVDRTVLGKILNHKGLAGDGQVTAIYDRHEYREERTEALQRWADELNRIITGQGEAASIYKLNA